MIFSNLLSFLLSSTAIATMQVRDQQSLEALRQGLMEKMSGAGGTFALAFKDLNSGDSLFINESEVFHAASTMKTAVMIEVFKQAEVGKFKLLDSIEVRNRFRSLADGSSFSVDPQDDGDPELYRSAGTRVTILSLVDRMITKSSNLGTNLLIELVSPEEVTKTAQELGATNLKILRGVEDEKAFRAGLNNTTTALDLVRLFERLARCDILTREACKEMVSILMRQEDKSKIPALLPVGVKTAHKTGSIAAVEHDSGIIFLPDGREYILVILSKNLKENKVGVQGIAEMSRFVYDYISTR